VVIRPLPAADGRPYLLDGDGDFWRMLSYVGGAASFERIGNGAVAREAGRALGLFHRLVWDLPPDRLTDTLPGFHVTPGYLADYDRLLRQTGRRFATAAEESCARAIEDRRYLAAVLEDAARDGRLPVKVIHGDPKPANIMFAVTSGRAVSMIDLDTVKPGLLHYDIGDCLRASCNPAGDNPAQLAEVRFESGICRDLLGGYLAEMAPLLTAADYEFIFPAVRLLAFELGLRFFTDHLGGDLYFKVHHRGHNLHRALAQFRLLAGIEEAEALIRAIVRQGRRDGGAPS
jgi:Ser/Thr protein kinase RdoA (MazF antagonist)